MRIVGWLLAIPFAAAVACGDTVTGDGEGGGNGGSDGSGGEPHGGAAGASSSGLGGTIEQTCDDLGFCGQQNDPGCVACSVTDGSCADELEACSDECRALDDCYRDCESDDPSCFAECETLHPDGIDLWNQLYTCILCVECPSSCNFDTANCP